MRSSETVNSIPGILAVATWSLFASIISYTGTLDPFLMLGTIYFFGSAIYIVKWSKHKATALAILKETHYLHFLLPIIGIGLHDLTWILSVKMIPPEQASIIIYQWPALIVIFTAILKKESLSTNQLTGVVICICGVFVLFSQSLFSEKTINLGLGHFSAIVSALTWSIYSAIISAKYITSSSLLGVNFLVTGVICLTIFAFSADSELGTGFLNSDYYSFVIYSIFMAVSYIFWEFSMRNGDVILLSSLSFLTPALSMLFLVVFEYADVSIHLILSIVFIMIGIYIANKKSIKIDRS